MNACIPLQSLHTEAGALWPAAVVTDDDILVVNPFRFPLLYSFQQFNEAFTSLFVVEVVIKLGLFGPVGYFSDGYNLFDFGITLLSLVEIIIQVRFEATTLPGFG